MPGVATKIGHGLAKVLQIKLDQRDLDDQIRRGESVFSSHTADTYVEQEPTTLGWFREITPSGRDLGQYCISLFPFLNWIGRYNLQWLIGDLVAGTSPPPLVVFRQIC
jgi:sodium-independent sulfate anion transporter 11